VNPFYFGRSERPLFGVHHPPAGPDRGGAVLLCYPVGDEYLRAHRAFRQLTNLLVREGFHVLRFDYSGTGDSAGDAAECRLEQWIEDIGTAAEELEASAGVDRISLAGLRLGATMAAAAAVGRTDLDVLVLWDPMPSGRTQLLAVEAWNGSRTGAAGDPGPATFPPGTIGTGGFPLTPDLAAELEMLELAELALPAGRIPGGIDIVVPREEKGLAALARRWSEEGAPARYRVVPSEGDWSRGDRFGSALIPQAIIQEVVRALTDAGPPHPPTGGRS
jgi:uncharacterized protein